MAPDDLVTVSEAAKLVGRHRSTVFAWIRDGHLRPSSYELRRGGETALLRWADVEACVAERAEAAAQYSTPRPTRYRPKAS